jgi:hypothetical protein
MCHERWFRRMHEEREADRKLWDEFERTRALSDTEPADEEADITLKRSEAQPAASER